jgi:DNA-binding MarR family transcriptional regulator
MDDDLDPAEVAAALRLSIGLFVRRQRQLPLPGEVAMPELRALSRLDRGGPATTSDLARAEQITPQAMGSTLAALEGRGLVRRSPDPSDGRRVVMSVTKAGKQALHNKRGADIKELARILTNEFSEEQIRILRSAVPLIERLGESL